MRRTKKLLLIGSGCAAATIALLVTAAVAVHLLANRDRVKSYILTKAHQATGGQLGYDRIRIDFFPLPHLAARNIQLTLPDALFLGADTLSVYPRILALLRGRLVIHRLRLTRPDMQMSLPAADGPNAPTADDAGTGFIPAAIERHIGAIFGALATIDPDTRVEIEQGRLTVDFPDKTAITVHAINAIAENSAHELSIELHCASDVVENLTLRTTVDTARSQARGDLSLTGIDPRRILAFAPLPAGIAVGEAQASADLDFTIDGAEHATGRLQIQVPDLSIQRAGRKLEISGLALAGEAAYEKNHLSLRLDKLATQDPALALSAHAVLEQAPDSGRANLQLSAATERLDIAVASEVCRALAGDQASIRTAFDFARTGVLLNPVYAVAFEHDGDAFRLTGMSATARLSQGRVNLSDINAEVENAAGEIAFKDDHVDFLNLAGRFEGASFKGLDVAMDWAARATWSVRSSSVDVDAAPFFTWLTGFEALAGIKRSVSIIDGRAAVSTLKISGPLTEPGQWTLEIIGSPQDLVVKSPRAPFDIKLSGGEITYRPGSERSSAVGITFLDASIEASHQSSGGADSPSVNLKLDGSLGVDALAWLKTWVSIPDPLQIVPPISLSGVSLTWDRSSSVSVTGGFKTANGMALDVDVKRSPESLELRKFKFSDGTSEFHLSASGKAPSIEATFAGNVEKQTLDRLLKTNRFLSGRIEGAFKTRIDTSTPFQSTFVGRLSGSGLDLHEPTGKPITVNRFSVVGQGNRVDLLPSEISLADTPLRVDGTVVSSQPALTFDINVDADQLGLDLIQTLGFNGTAHPPAGGAKPPPAMVLSGMVHLNTRSLTYGGFTWSPVNADIQIAPDGTHVTIKQARLCGISTPGEVDITSQGIGFDISPQAVNASLQQTSDCLWDNPLRIDARYDLEGRLLAEPVQKDPLASLSGRATLSSQNGRIHHSSTLLKIFSMLNITELFTGGRSDLAEDGYGYARAWVKAHIEGGKLHLEEILLDGNALKITGQGSIDLKGATANIILLAAPLKTVDRIVNKLPIIRYITGGALISVPLRLTGKLTNLSVVPLPPSAVGKGLLHLMERTLKAPFKLGQSAKDIISETVNQR